MKNQQHKESGLAHIGIIIAAILVVAALAFGGWYVWDKNKEDKQTNNSTSQNNNQDKEKIEPPVGWKLYQNNEAGFSFYYPPEWGAVGGSESGGFLFADLRGASFRVNQKNKEHSQGDFVTQLNVIDVVQENSSAIVTSVTGHEPATEQETFSGDEVISFLPNSRACVMEDVSMYELSGDPDSKNSHVYLGFCGLNSNRGAFAFSSNSHDITEPSTKELKENIVKMLETFDIY